MKLEQSFDVQAPIDQVWAALIDLERVAPCLPGAAITGRDDDGTYHGTFQVKLGPTTASYRGTIAIDEADESAHRATLKARGTDKRGQGGASATIVNTLTESGGTTTVEAVTDFTITGRLAAFGRGGMIKDISNRLMRDFASCLQSRLGEEPAPAEPTGAAVTAGDASADTVAAAEGPPPPAPGVPPTEPGADAPHDLHPGGGPRSAPASAPATQPEGSPPPPAPAPAAAPAPAKPVNGLSLFLGVLWERIRRLFGR
jgi:carbon monoxide dehydrogenase subunit G